MVSGIKGSSGQQPPVAAGRDLQAAAFERISGFLREAGAEQSQGKLTPESRTQYAQIFERQFGFVENHLREHLNAPANPATRQEAAQALRDCERALQNLGAASQAAGIELQVPPGIAKAMEQLKKLIASDGQAPQPAAPKAFKPADRRPPAAAKPTTRSPAPAKEFKPADPRALAALRAKKLAACAPPEPAKEVVAPPVPPAVKQQKAQSGRVGAEGMWERFDKPEKYADEPQPKEVRFGIKRQK